MAVSISISITQNSQNITNNTSNVTVKVNCSWTGGSYNAVVNANGDPQPTGVLTIDGTDYSFRSSFNTGKTTTGSQTLFTKTVNIKHNDNGAKTLSCSASFTTHVSSGTVSASANKSLTTIPRKSELQVSNGTLGKTVSVKVVQKSTSFTHTVKAYCGTAADSHTLCVTSKSTSLEFVPPLNWAKYNTSGTTVSVNITITTYNGSTNIGSNTYTIICSIPTSVTPGCLIYVKDPVGLANSYGYYIKGRSKLQIDVYSTEAYDSPIESCKVTADGTTYSKLSITPEGDEYFKSSVTTDIIKNAGQLTITAEVKDKRGRTETKSVTVNVLDYSLPVISSLTVRRCNENGVLNDKGEWVQVTFSATVTNPNGKNTCGYAIETKKSSDEQYTRTELTALNNTFSVNGATYVFQADSGSSYDVRLTAYDSLGSYSRTTSVSTAYTIQHWKANGLGMAIGKISELDDLFDIGMQTRLLGGLLYPVIESGTDLNDVKTPGFYVGKNLNSSSYGHCPLSSGTFLLEVMSGGEDGQLLQRVTRCHKTEPQVFERWFYSGDWTKENNEYVWTGGWIYPSVGSEFAIYSTDGGNPPMYRKDGRIVEVRGIVKPVSDIAGDTNMHTIFTLPAGYRPSNPIYVICQGSSNGTWLLRVNTTGTVDMSRYRNGGTAATATAGTWLPFQVTFLV